MSPSERAWLYVPGNEQTLRLPVSRRFTNRNDLSVGCYLHSALGGSLRPHNNRVAKVLLFLRKLLTLITQDTTFYVFLTLSSSQPLSPFTKIMYFCAKI